MPRRQAGGKAKQTYGGIISTWAWWAVLPITPRHRDITCQRRGGSKAGERERAAGSRQVVAVHKQRLQSAGTRSRGTGKARHLTVSRITLSEDLSLIHI